jgi:hypothetical protein
MQKQEPHIIDFKQIGTPNLGYISVAEVASNISFEIKRVYWTYFTPNHVERGNHGHIALQQVIVSVAGVIQFSLESITGEKYKFVLDKPSKGIFIPPGYWREMKFSHNAVLLCMASLEYDEKDYIRDYKEFKNLGDDSDLVKGVNSKK